MHPVIKMLPVCGISAITTNFYYNFALLTIDQ